jgi:hypothetical protein
VCSQNLADVRFNPKVTELLRGSEMTECADSERHPTCSINRERALASSMFAHDTKPERPPNPRV